MDNKIRCQSCGMPLSDEFDNYGANADGTENKEYCTFCFQNGDFTKPQLTLEEMIQLSTDNMVEDLKMSQDKAQKLAREVIPTLKRWKQ